MARNNPKWSRRNAALEINSAIPKAISMLDKISFNLSSLACFSIFTVRFVDDFEPLAVAGDQLPVLALAFRLLG